MALAGELAINIIGNVKGLKTSFSETKNMTQNLQKNINKFGQGLQSAGTKMTKFVTGPIAALGAGMFAVADKTADYADEIEKTSQRMGLSMEKTQEWKFISEQLGTNLSSLERGLTRFQKRVGEADDGLSSAVRAFDNLNIEFKDSQGNLRRMDDLFPETIQKLANMEDVTKRNQLAMELFGRGGKELIPILNAGGNNIEALTQKAHELGIVMEDDAIKEGVNFKDTIHALKQEFAAIFRDLGTELIPIIKDDLVPIIRKDVIPAISSLIGFVSKLFRWFSNLPGPVKGLITKVGALAAALGPAAVGLGGVISALSGPISAIIGLLGGVSGGGIVAAITPLLGPAGLIAAAIALFVMFDDEIIAFVEGALFKLGESLVKLGELFPEIWGNIKKYTVELWNDIVKFIKGLPSKMLQLGRDIIQGLIDGIKEKITAPLRMIKNLGQNMVDGLKGMLGINSPSKVFEEMGKQSLQGFVKGLGGDSLNGTSLVGAGGAGTTINMTINQHITDQQTAEHANNDLLTKLQNRGIGGSFR